MSYLHTLLTKERIFCNYWVENKKALLHNISVAFAKDIDSMLQLDELTLLDDFIKREKLGTTAIGEGIAIPHIRVDGLNKPIGAFFKLTHAIPFDAADQAPVDLVFALIVPTTETNQHLKILSEITKVLSSPLTRSELRELKTPHELYSKLLNASHAIPA
jgi:PTS system nitrogen regulatory IIA component